MEEEEEILELLLRLVLEGILKNIKVFKAMWRYIFFHFVMSCLSDKLT